MTCKLRVLVAVKPEALSKVIVYLLGGLPAVEIWCSRGRSHLLKNAVRYLPHAIIVNDRFTPDTDATIRALKRAIPQAKVILTSWHVEFPKTRSHKIVDARLDETSLVSQLIPALRRLFVCQKRRPVSRRTAKRRIQ